MASPRPAATTSTCSIKVWWAFGRWRLRAAKISRELVARMQAYMEKATHEAKVYTSWINPDAQYDAAVRQFVAAVLDDHPKNRFLAGVQPVSRTGGELGPLRRARANAAQTDLAGRARHLPGPGAVGFQPGRSGQPPAGRLRQPPEDARPLAEGYRSPRAIVALGRPAACARPARPAAEAVSHLAHASSFAAGRPSCFAAASTFRCWPRARGRNTSAPSRGVRPSQQRASDRRPLSSCRAGSRN